MGVFGLPNHNRQSGFVAIGLSFFISASILVLALAGVHRNNRKMRVLQQDLRTEDRRRLAELSQTITNNLMISQRVVLVSSSSQGLSAQLTSSSVTNASVTSSGHLRIMLPDLKCVLSDSSCQSRAVALRQVAVSAEFSDLDNSSGSPTASVRYFIPNANGPDVEVSKTVMPVRVGT